MGGGNSGHGGPGFDSHFFGGFGHGNHGGFNFRTADEIFKYFILIFFNK